MCGPGLGSAQGGWLRWRTLGEGGTDTQVENPSHRLHQTKATTTGHVMKNCFLSGLCLVSRVIQQVVDVSCLKMKIHTWCGVI